MNTTANPHQADKTVTIHGANGAVAAATTAPAKPETISRVRAETRKPPDDDADRERMIASSHRGDASVGHGRDGYAATMEGWTAAPFVPDTDSLAELQKAAAHCTGCPLFHDTTQTVFGEGPASASLCLVGEQPGDQEDRIGHPFVGPAGGVLSSCLTEAGVDAADVYVTNAVKHFKHEQRGKRRLHKKPGTAEVTACHPWLAAEFAVVRPAVIVALGATAARAVLGRTVGIVANRGRTFEAAGRPVVVTYHPSAVLRAIDDADEIREALVADIRRAAGLVA
jgi:DNA polymerase